MSARRLAYRPQFYTSPINLAERRVGKLRIVHEHLEGETYVVSMRQALLRGMHAVRAKLDAPLRVHKLVDDAHGVWMTDHPSELNDIGEALYSFRPRGRVLVGGLGLGILAATLAQLVEVESVAVVERSRDVVSLCKAPGYRVVRGDVGRYLKLCDDRHDCFMLDTWQGTGESTWWTEVLPLRRTIANRFGRRARVWCWQEDVMIAQVHAAAALQAGKHWHYRVLPAGATRSEIARFTKTVGEPAWERSYGDKVDRFVFGGE